MGTFSLIQFANACQLNYLVIKSEGKNEWVEFDNASDYT